MDTEGVIATDGVGAWVGAWKGEAPVAPLNCRDANGLATGVAAPPPKGLAAGAPPKGLAAATGAAPNVL